MPTSRRCRSPWTTPTPATAPAPRARYGCCPTPCTPPSRRPRRSASTVGQIANSLIFDADGQPLLVLTSGAHRVDTARVAADLGLTRAQTGHPGVRPAAHRTADRRGRPARAPEAGAHPGRHGPGRLRRDLGGRRRTPGGLPHHLRRAAADHRRHRGRGGVNSVPGLVTLHVWRTPRRALPRALMRMARDPRRLRGAARRTVRQAPRHRDRHRLRARRRRPDPVGGAGRLGRPAARRPASTAGPVGRAWGRIATRRRPAGPAPGQQPRSSGPGVQPFGDPAGGRTPGPVLALTRARLRPARAVTFWRAVPPVAAALRTAPGLLARFGVGEAPIGWQGTVSVWRDPADLVDVRVPSARAPGRDHADPRPPAGTPRSSSRASRYATSPATGRCSAGTRTRRTRQ